MPRAVAKGGLEGKGQGVLVLDGATGTELAKHGVDTRGPLFSAEALRTSEGRAALLAVHQAYLDAGADILTTCTFRTAKHLDLARIACDLGRSLRASHLAGSMAPIEDCYRPELRPPPEEAYEIHARHAEVLAAGGCDLLLVETVAAADEGLAAVRAAKATGKPVWVSAMVMPDGRMRSGDDLAAFFAAAGADACLINCVPCDAIDHAIYDGAYANMGEVDPASGWPSSRVLTPDEYAARAARWIAKGAWIVGGCCGTTPQHIAALTRLRDRGVSRP